MTISTRKIRLRATARGIRRPPAVVIASTLLIMSADDLRAVTLSFGHAGNIADTASMPGGLIAAAAQDDDRFQIEDVSGASGKPLRVWIRIKEVLAGAPQSADGPFFLMFEGIPPEIKLSAGFQLKQGVWVVSVKDTGNLTLSAPPGFSAAFDVKAVLRRGKQTEPRSFTFNVSIDHQTAPVAAVQALPPGQPAAPMAPTAINPEEENVLMTRAEALFRGGDLQASRLIYAELAKRGSHRAALRLAQTYDPQVLSSLFVVGAEPNLEKARELYKRAAEMGATEAQKRLEVLANSNPP